MFIQEWSAPQLRAYLLVELDKEQAQSTAHANLMHAWATIQQTRVATKEESYRSFEPVWRALKPSPAVRNHAHGQEEFRELRGQCVRDWLRSAHAHVRERIDSAAPTAPLDIVRRGPLLPPSALQVKAPSTDPLPRPEPVAQDGGYDVFLKYIHADEIQADIQEDARI